MASQSPFPLMPSKSTQLRIAHFDDSVYTGDSTTLVYKIVDAMCGDSGAGSLKKEIFIQRLSGAITGIYGTDLDYIFGNIHFLSRAPSESYTYDPMGDQLNSDAWDEVRVKDAWYRARITEYFRACCAGGTRDGIRMAVHAATSVDCEVFEGWRYLDEFGLTDPVGRANLNTIPAGTLDDEGHAPANGRNEVVVRPNKAGFSPKEMWLLRDMLANIVPLDTIATIDQQGLSVTTPVPVRAVAADSTYFEVQKIITGTPMLEDLPPPELLPVDLNPSEQWLLSGEPQWAPYAQFNISQESSYYYLVSGGARSPIDAVSYARLASDGVTLTGQMPFEMYEQTGQYTDWMEYDRADSPDNYPGGKFGVTPDTVPAIRYDRTPYPFPYTSQADYVAAKKAEVIRLGGIADDMRYRLPLLKEGRTKRTYTADLAIASTPPVRDSTVTSSWTGRRMRPSLLGKRDPAMFVRA